MSAAGGMRVPEPVGVRDARRLVLDGVRGLPPVEAALEDAQGRYLAEAVRVFRDIPSADVSAMDGFAVRAADTAGAGETAPASLQLEGEARAGSPWPGTIGPGQAVAISTGAEVPAGADAVARREVCSSAGSRVEVHEQVAAGAEIRFRGEVAGAGDRALAEGTRVGAVELGVLIACGSGTVPCRKKPVVNVVSTGDELADPGAELGEGGLWNSNRAVLAAMARAEGAEVVSQASVGDGFDQTVEALRSGLESDLLVISGGVSVGEHDHVKPALEALGAEELFWGLALKPGRPAWFGKVGGCRVLGVPGNPVSALVVFRLLGVPILRALAGAAEPDPELTGVLLSRVERLSQKMRVVPVRTVRSGGRVGLEVLGGRGSHDFVALAGADSLALIEAGSGAVEAGEDVGLLRLPGQ
jgi:molybdopterin molybdotransferase